MRIISPLLAFICCLPASVTAVEPPPSIAIQLADRYLQSFVEEVKRVPEAKKPKILDASITAIHLSPRAVRGVVFNEIFAKSGYYQERYQQVDKVLNPYVWNDLHLFCGTTTTPTYHFLSRINRTITVLGEGALASLLGAPVANLETLSKRQQFINFLSQNNQIYADLKNQLAGYKGSEKGMLSFWTKTDPLYTKEYDKYLTGLFYTSSATSNKSASALQTKKILLRDIWNIYSNYIWYPLIGLPITEIYYQIFSAKNNKYTSRGDFYSKMYWDYMPVYNFYRIGTSFSKDKEPASTSEKLSRSLNSIKPSRYLNATIVTAHSLFQYYKGYANYKEYTAVLKNLALRMSDLQTFLMTAKKINALVQQTPALEEVYGEQLRPIRDLLARLNEPSEEGKLLRYLDQLPFRSWSYLFDHAGKLLASYKLFLEHKALFHDAMYAVGELDALVSIATLMWEKAASDGAHGYTFTKFLSPQAYTQPRLTLTQMWNPMLSPTTAIGNDVTMDRATKTQTIILTGPNAGGKSTFLSGVALSVLLSQTFGIAPAKSCEMTPFSKINTYIDVTDDIAAGKSLFLAEVDRFQSHLKILEGLKKDAFSFSIFDEPFSGTNPVEGAAAEYSVLNYIAKYGNALNIVATHYPIVMLLEQREADKGFKNYKVFIKSLGKDGKIQYTYKVVPGASDQTIAIDILKEQGYGTEMLEKAREIISHPDQYKKSFSK